MNWLPYNRFEIESPLAKEAALAALAAHVEPAQVFRITWPSEQNNKRFQGEITGDKFNVYRVIGYRNSFRPAVEGEVQAVGRMSRILVTMRPTIFVFIFGGFWLFIALSVLTIGGGGLWIGLGMLAFFYLMTMAGFWFEASKQEAALREIFQSH